MKARLIYCALVLVPALSMAGCSNLAGKSPEYIAEHQRVFWQSLTTGGGTEGAAQAWANYRAHEAAEAATGQK